MLDADPRTLAQIFFHGVQCPFRHLPDAGKLGVGRSAGFGDEAVLRSAAARSLIVRMLIVMRAVVPGLAKGAVQHQRQARQAHRQADFRAEFGAQAAHARIAVFVSRRKFALEFKGQVFHDALFEQEGVQGDALYRGIVAVLLVAVAEIGDFFVAEAGRDHEAVPFAENEALAHAVLVHFGDIAAEHIVHGVAGTVEAVQHTAEFAQIVLIGHVVEVIAVAPRRVAYIAVAHTANPEALFVGVYHAVSRAHTVVGFAGEAMLVVQDVQGQPRLVLLAGMGTVLDAGHEADAPHVGGIEGQVAAFVDNMEIGLGIEAAKLAAVAAIGNEQAALAGRLGGQHHEGSVHDGDIKDVQRRMVKRGIAVDLHLGFLGGKRPRRAFSVAERDLGVLEGVAVAEKLIDLRAGNVHMRPGHEDSAVPEPAGTAVEVELRLLGVQKVAPHAHFHIALHEDPVRRRVVAGEIGLHVIVAALEEHAAGSFHDDAVINAHKLVGFQRPRGLALGVHGLLRIEHGIRIQRSGAQAYQHGAGGRCGPPERGRKKYGKKHGSSRLQVGEREGRAKGKEIKTEAPCGHRPNPLFP